MYRVIMVPVDGSAFSREAVFQGLRLAEKSRAQLRLVRVGSIPVVVGGPETAALESKAWGTDRANMLTHLYRLAAECRANTHVDVTATLEDGPIADALRGHALRHSVDLIVMATHARRGMARVWLGSVADRLIRQTRIPVLAVRPPSIATELASGACFKQVLVSLDGSVLAEQCLDPAFALATMEQAEVTLLRVIPAEKDIPPGEMQALIGQARARDVDDAHQYLAGLVTRLDGRNLSIHTAVVVANDIPAAILGFAETHEMDIVAMATHGRGGIARAMIGSVADRVLSEGAVSTLILHPSNVVAGGLSAEAQPDLALAAG